jgi:chain length determinant protein EpsF
MDISQFMLALRARRKAFLLVLAATIATAIAVALIVPKRYDATATLLVDARDEQAMTPARVSPRERAGYISTQVDLVRSGRVATQVARDLKLAQRPAVREAWEEDTGGLGSIDDWIAANLLDKLKVDTSASNILTVTYASEDPRFAAAVANAFAKAYLDTTLQLRTEPTREAAEWFEEQLKAMRAQVNQAQTKLTRYQKAKGITYADERTDVDGAHLAELSTMYLAARNATYDAESRFQQAREVTKNGAGPEALPDLLSSVYLNGLKADLVRAEARLQEASIVLGPNHPVYQRTAAEAQGLREKLSAEMKKAVAGLGNSLAQSRKREQELKAALDAQSRRVAQMKDARVELTVMTRDVESAQRAYDAVLARYMTNRVDSRAKTTNVALLTPAVEPLRPAHPKVGLITALAVLVGGLLAGGVVYVLESLDRRVRSRADLESRLAVPSLGRLSRWQPMGGRLLPSPARAARALPHPW